MNPTRRGSESEGSNPTSSASPTPTVRDNRPLPPIADASPSISEQSSDKTPQPSGIGKGHPVQRPIMTSASTSPTAIASLRPTVHDRTPEPSPHRPPRGRDSPAVHYPSGHDQTPRVGGSMRGIPRNSDALGSPHRYPDSGGSSAARPGYGRNQTSTAYPVSYPVNPSHSGHGYQSSTMGTVSRSASRARIPLKDVAAPPKKGDNEDDEEEVVDRGADLIKRRQKERKQARKKKEQERRKAEGGVTPAITPGITPGITPNASAPPSGVPGESFGGQQDRMAIARSASRSRVGSSALPDGGESYFGSSWSSSITPHGPPSPRDELHPPSIYSSAADDDEEEEDDTRASMVNEVIHDVVEEAEEEEEDEDDEGDNGEDDEGVTLKDRQDAINIEHPFGLPIWKPALYRKTRSVTRNAESALHAVPSAAAERHFLPGNILWTLLFGWWLAIACFVVALLVSGAEVLGGGRGGYGKTLRGLAWYIGWPFGKYVEGEGAPEDSDDSDEEEDGDETVRYGASDNGSPTSRHRHRHPSDGASSGITVRDTRRAVSDAIQASGESVSIHPQRAATTISFAPSAGHDDERVPLIRKAAFRRPRNQKARILGRIIYWPLFVLVVAPIMLFVCVLCWGLVFTIPMAKLTWALIKLLATRPLEINFRAAPRIAVQHTPSGSPGSMDGSGDTTAVEDSSPSGYIMKRARLKAGQVAPTAGPKSTVLLCVYRAMGVQYYKYTIMGVNIIFIDLLPLIFFTIADDFIFLPAVERGIARGHYPSPFIAFLTSQSLIFVLSLASVIPLSYFIGMAVASISAQSSIGMGAVINATFGSIIEIILYSIALVQGKGRLVEGSIVGSILAGVLLMPGLSMLSGALKRKEQKFNAKSAGVTSTMLIMATIGTLTPTMFYQIYGSFDLKCEGCPLLEDAAWQCNRCYYEHPDPATDPFYQDNVKVLMYACAAVLLLSYLIGLWFSLRTHAAQIWQNPQQLMKAEELGQTSMHPAHRSTLTQRITPQNVMQHVLPLHKSLKESSPASRHTSRPASLRAGTTRFEHDTPRDRLHPHRAEEGSAIRGTSSSRMPTSGYTPFLESVDRNMKDSSMGNMKLPSHLTTEDFTRAVAAATVSALRHQSSVISQNASGHKPRAANISAATEEEEHEGGGHESPNWTRGVSTGVLLGCTVLFAMIAEILVDVVDVVLEGVAIDEKFLGLTLFTLIPNTTEFMNAMSFAMNGNIALSMEIGSAYALQVCLLQIPFMVGFSAFWDPKRMGEDVDTFNLIFPQWDVIAIILSIFLLTYTYIEARSNYHRGSTLVLSYLVLVMGFYFAPNRGQGDVEVPEGLVPTLGHTLTKLWA